MAAFPYVTRVFLDLLFFIFIFWFFTVNSLLFFIGIELISDVVFVPSVQEFNLVIYRHLSILFQVLFCI